MKPDVLLTWPSGVDYPLCRLQLETYKKYFNKIIVAYYSHGTPNFIPFVATHHKDWVFVESVETGPAWRDRAVNRALSVSTSNWVLFTEQDFFWRDDDFWWKVQEAQKNNDIIGIRQGSRLHPCFLLARRELIDKTSKDFDPQGQDLDHFSKVSQEILELGRFIDLKDLGLYQGKNWYHFSSLTWNLFRCKDQNVRETHELPEFLVYNAYSRTPRVPQDLRWLVFTYYVDSLLTGYGRFLNS